MKAARANLVRKEAGANLEGSRPLVAARVALQNRRGDARWVPVVAMLKLPSIVPCALARPDGDRLVGGVCR